MSSQSLYFVSAMTETEHDRGDCWTMSIDLGYDMKALEDKL